MELRELLAGADVVEITGDADVEIEGLAYDSRDVRPGSLFFCTTGFTVDGHEFAPLAVQAGAVAVVVERRLELEPGVVQAQVTDVRAAMAHAAVRFYADPTAELRVLGVTGTNGKTTTAFLIRQILEHAGVQTGLLGTVKRVVAGTEEPVERTTPEAIDLQATFRRMADGGDRACAIEVSSHALTLNRADGVRFAVAAFTNLTQDHLDFHSDMEDYFQAKRRLFVGGRAETAVVNIDDPYGQRLVAEIEPVTFSAGADERADLRALEPSFDASGSRFVCAAPEGEFEVRLPLPGRFNVENALCAIASVRALGVGVDLAAAALAEAERVPGRFEPVDEGQPFAVLVDYAHTPDSLENVLVSARQITAADGRLICVFGCGGDRDREKRPLMGRDRRPARRPRGRDLRQPAVRGPTRDPRRGARGDRRRRGRGRGRAGPTGRDRPRAERRRPARHRRDRRQGARAGTGVRARTQDPVRRPRGGAGGAARARAGLRRPALTGPP